jgi:hypothetical protein
MGKVVWKGWSTSWDQITVPVTIAINPTPKIEKKLKPRRIKNQKNRL